MSTQFQHINPIVFDSGKAGSHLLIIAGVHGDEYEPILAVQQLAETLQKTSLLEKGKITLVVTVNQPAFDRDQRTAEDGLDLARTCPGKSEGSQTEVIAYEISQLIAQSDFLIDMHTGGALFEISAMVGYVLHELEDVLDQQRKMAEAFNLPIIWGTSPHLEGRTLSVARDCKVPAIYTEYGGGGDCRGVIVSDLVEGCCGVMNYLGLTAQKSVGVSKVEFVVEDYRNQSGHLQIMYPAPMDGIFSASIDLWQTVVEGQILGYVDNVEGQNQEVRASENGIVFLIRRQALVAAEDALLGILPISKKGKKVIYESK